MNFKKSELRERKQQYFDKDTITITMSGKTYNMYDSIQEAREDTEIYPTLEKYGCLDPIMVNKEQMYLDLRGWKTDARSLTEMTMKADEMWNKLPHDIKAKFENNRDIFMRDGEKWLKSEIEKEKPAEVATPAPAETTGGTTNE